MGKPSDTEIAKLQQDLFYTLLSAVMESKANSVVLPRELSRAFRFYNDTRTAYNIPPADSTIAFQRTRIATDRAKEKQKVSNPEKEMSLVQPQINEVRMNLFNLVLDAAKHTRPRNAVYEPSVTLSAPLVKALRAYHQLVTDAEKYEKSFKHVQAMLKNIS